MFTLGSIRWPENRTVALRRYLKFLVFALETLEIRFLNNKDDPIRITKRFLDGNLLNGERSKVTAIWWDYVDSQGAIREFEDKDILMARLAICLLSVSEKDAEQLGENLSWFFEILGFLGADVDKAIELMEIYFKSEH